MFRGLFLVLVLLATVAGQLCAMNEKEVDRLFQDFSGPDTPGAAVMVIKDGAIVFEKAFGSAALETHIPCTTQTNFRLASLTKQFTAMSVLMLAEKGKLSLEDSITRYFPGFPAYGRSITMHHLLTHTSGLIDYEDIVPEGTNMQLSDRDVVALLQKQDHTYFPPGKEFRYSNSGYALLALIVEEVSGETYPAFLHHHIFAPIGMTTSLAYVAGVSEIPHRAYGYARGAHGWEPSDQSLTSAVLGDGGIYSSVADLFKWDQALYGEKLVSEKTKRNAFAAHSAVSDFEGSGYGLGWYVGKRDGITDLWHYGSTCGFSTRIHRFPAKRLTVILLTNRRDADIVGITDKLIAMNW